MNIERRNFYGLSAAIVIPLLAGCATRHLYKEKFYDENFSSLYVTQDQKKIVIIGREYHYIFEASPGLMGILMSDLRSQLIAGFHSFTVDGNAISGNCVLSLRMRNGNPGVEQERVARSLGFSRGMNYQEKMAGIRYVAPAEVSDIKGFQKLNKEYSVRIQEIPSVGEKAVRAILSPVAVAADGVMMVAAIPLIPVFFVLAAGAAPYAR